MGDKKHLPRKQIQKIWSKYSWKELKQNSRHGLGFEKINKNSINAPLPQFMSEDVDHFLAFRYSGKKAMLGYRQKEVFFVLWFDHDFTLYKH